MKDDIKTDQANQPQFQQPSSPPRTVDGISPPVLQNPAAPSQAAPPNQPASQPEQPVELAQAPNSEVANQTSNPKEQPPITKKPSKKHNILPVLTAIIILLVLSSLAIYAGLVRDNEPSSNESNNSPAQSDNQSQISEDNQSLQETIELIDKLPEETDTSGDNLADKNLGL